MQRLETLLRLLQYHLYSKEFVAKVCIIAFIYTLVSLYVINALAFVNILGNNHGFATTLLILVLLLSQTAQSLSLFSLFLLIVTAFLFGINLELIAQRIQLLMRGKNLKITVGAGIASIVASGCSTCGLSLLSILGLTGAIAALPFHGVEIAALGATTLLATLFYNLDSINKTCDIPLK